MISNLIRKFSSPIVSKQLLKNRALHASFIHGYTPQLRCFATSDIGAQRSSGRGKKISSKVLCDITGTRYYQHNEEIEYEASKVIRLFDENDVNLGEMKFGEAYNLAMDLEKDIVLRNVRTSPPVMKIMNYRLELLKRLFKKLGREINQKDQKAKSITLNTTISMHDLENKKRKSIELLKNIQVIKYFMKVNVYDPENVQKGRLILLNLAEDLKDHCKIKVHPSGKKTPQKTEKSKAKPESPEEIEKLDNDQFVKLSGEDGIEMEDEGLDLNSRSYIYMELESTSSFKDIDIDKMLEHTSMEDFMRGLYVTGIEKSQAIKSSSAGDQTKQVMAALMTG